MVAITRTTLLMIAYLTMIESLNAATFLYELDSWQSTFNPSGSSSDDSFGFEFSTTSSLEVSELGAFERNPPSFNEGILVSLWNATTEALVASATIASGTLISESVSPFGGYAYAAITPVTLSAGSYRLVAAAADGAWGNGDVMISATLTEVSGISLGEGARATSGSGSTFPGLSGSASSGGQWVTVDMKFTAVPEPAEFGAAAMFGLLGFGVIRRWHRARISDPS